MLRRVALLCVLVACGVDRNPLYVGGSAAGVGAVGGVGGSSDAGGTGGIGGTGGLSGVGGTSDAGGTGGMSGQAGSGGVSGQSGIGGTAGPCSDDMDGDTFISQACGGDDCDDTQSDVHPGGFDSCNNLDDDCNGVVDDGFAVVACFLPNTSLALCTTGVCTVTFCNAGFTNCDGNNDNGCETRTDFTPFDCKDLDCAGNVKAQPADLPADDGNDCTTASCNGSAPLVTNTQDGTSCGSNGGMCLAGVCTN